MESEALPDDFRDLLIALADARVAFVVVGGYALAAHGHLRATDDLDILVEPTAANARRVFAALARSAHRSRRTVSSQTSSRARGMATAWE